VRSLPTTVCWSVKGCEPSAYHSHGSFTHHHHRRNVFFLYVARVPVNAQGGFVAKVPMYVGMAWADVKVSAGELFTIDKDDSELIKKVHVSWGWR